MPVYSGVFRCIPVYFGVFRCLVGPYVSNYTESIGCRACWGSSEWREMLGCLPSMMGTNQSGTEHVGFIRMERDAGLFAIYDRNHGINRVTL